MCFSRFCFCLIWIWLWILLVLSSWLLLPFAFLSVLFLSYSFSFSWLHLKQRFPRAYHLLHHQRDEWREEVEGFPHFRFNVHFFCQPTHSLSLPHSLSLSPSLYHTLTLSKAVSFHCLLFFAFLNHF